MILTIDVGNTNVVLGCVEDGVVVSRSRLATNTSDLPNDYAMKMRQTLRLTHRLPRVRGGDSVLGRSAGKPRHTLGRAQAHGA